MHERKSESAVRVLLVDDEPAVVRALGQFLGRQGFAVESAANGRAAIEQIRADSFDVVVSDIRMPDMDGLELLRAVRALDLDVPVILMTAMPTIDTAARAVEYGALRYLIKPVALSKLAGAVHHGARLAKMAHLKREALAHLGAQGQLAGDRAGLETRFALAARSLWMAYQPLVSWSTRAVYAYEALVRSSEPSLPGGSVLMEAAERLEQLPYLAERIRSRVAADVSAADGSGAPGSPLLFVNLNPLDLLNDERYDTAHPFCRLARRVVLEITERSSLDAVPNITERVVTLRNLGFRFAVDDLGAGYAGLSSVVRLQPDVVKFDMALVRDIDREPTKRRLVRSMVAVCNDMGVTTVAEGVETPAERDALVDLGCDILQGYLFARPGTPFPEPVWES